MILDVKQLNKIRKLNYFYTLKALLDDQGKIKMYSRMSRVKKQLSGKTSIVLRFKIAVMVPLIRAERAKVYREKKIEKVREREALLKKLGRVKMKVSTPEKNKARLLKKRLGKQEYRKE